MRHRKYTCNAHYFDAVKTEQQAYFLGFLFADGCNTGNSVALHLQEQDAAILVALKSAMESNHPILHRKNRPLVCFCMYSPVLADRLDSLGCTSHKRETLVFPDYLSKEMLPHFIRGFWDGNGYIADVSKQKGRYPKYRISVSGTEEFCTVLADILTENTGVRCGMEKARRTLWSWHMTIGGRLQVKSVLDYLYGNAAIALERQWNLAKQILTEEFVDHRFDKTSA
jgi:hypothetical protein